jgi:hypothetical protein
MFTSVERESNINFAYIIKNIKLQRFGGWILLPSSGMKMGRGQKAYMFRPLNLLASDLVQLPKRCSFIIL